MFSIGTIELFVMLIILICVTRAPSKLIINNNISAMNNIHKVQ